MKNNDILHSWKDISDYLDRNIRTCHRWEKELGLPVNRIDTESTRSKVFAYKSEIDQWLKEKANNKEIKGKSLSKNLIKTFIPVLAIISFIIIAAAIWRPLLRKKVVPIPQDKPSLAVMYFDNNTRDKSLDYWRKALSDLLIADLSQSNHIKVLSGEKLLNILEELDLSETKSYSLKDLEKVSALGRVQYVLVGKLAKAGETLRLNVLIQDAATGELISSEMVEGIGEKSLFSMLDQLTPRIKSNFMLTPHEIAADNDKEIGKITTSSPEAYKYYIEGTRYYKEGSFKESIKVLEKAVGIDPEFAMAYKSIAKNYDYLDNQNMVKENLQKALILRNRVSDREVYLIQGAFLYMVEKSDEKAIKTYQELLDLYPDDEKGMILLAAIYRNQEEWDKAQEWIEKIIHVNNRSHFAYLNLAHIYKAKGLYDIAGGFLQQNKHLFTNPALYHRIMARVFLCQGRSDLAFAELKNALSLEPDDYRNPLLTSYVHHIKGDLKSAIKACQELLEKDDPRSQSLGRLWMGCLYLTQGEYDKCKKELMLGIECSQKYDIKILESELLLLLAYLNIQQKNFADALYVSSLAREIAANMNSVGYEILASHFQGLACLYMKKMDDANRMAEHMKQQIEKSGAKKHMRYYYHLVGMMARERGLISQSVDYLENALSFLPNQKDEYDEHAFYLEAAASVHFLNRDFEEAQDCYEEITSLTTGRLRWGDIYARSYYWLGKIYQQKRLKEKAIEQYEKFLQIWEDADPGLPELADAKEQLSALR